MFDEKHSTWNYVIRFVFYNVKEKKKAKKRRKEKEV
jgi:hypothetical protein